MLSASPDTKDLGYILYPRRRPHEPGYPRLDVILRTTPTGHHFDPLQVRLNVVASDLGVTRLAIEHPWPDSDDYTVCAGTVELVDRKRKHLEAFTFGGALHIKPEEEETILVLTSPAPILLPAESSLEQLLVDEVEIILAQRQAIREIEPGLYEKRLAAAPPLELYHAILSAILERYRLLPSGDDDLVLGLRHSLHVELNSIEEGMSVLHRRPIEGLL